MNKIKGIVIAIVSLLLLAGGSIVVLGYSGYFETKTREKCQMIFSGIEKGKIMYQEIGDKK
jgi:hypothetical protein